MRSDRDARARLRWLVSAGMVGIAVGWLLDVAGVCPSVKRIWTPSWTLFSGGWCFLFLAAFHAVVDLGGWRRPAFPLVVIGMNSIAAYMSAHLFEGFFASSLRTHLGRDTFKVFGVAYEPLLLGACVLLGYWLTLLWMYRRRLFLRI